MVSPSPRNRIADDLRAAITGGTLAAGDRLPTEADLVEQYGLNRSTVRRALDALRYEGLIVSSQGRGYFVPTRARLVWDTSQPERNTATDVSPSDAWSRQMRDQGHEPTERIEVLTEHASDLVAERLRTDGQDLVVVRRRTRALSGRPECIADSHYPHQLVAGTPIAEPGDVLPGVYAVLEKLGAGWTHHHNEVRARAASMAEAQRLQLVPGQIVIEHVRTSHTPDGRPVRCTVMVARGDRTVVTYDQTEGS